MVHRSSGAQPARGRADGRPRMARGVGSRRSSFDSRWAALRNRDGASATRRISGPFCSACGRRGHQEAGDFTMSDRSLGDLLKAGHRGLCPELVEKLPVPWRLRGSPATDYDLTDEALVAAVQTALLLGQPLILAGEPGVGKTSLAAALENRLGLFLHDPVQVKSVTTGLDLFYTFDEVARFRDAGRPRDEKEREGRDTPKGLRNYVRFSSLGRAILWSAGPDAQVATGSVPSQEIMGRPEITTLRLGDLFPLEFRRD